MTFKSLAISRTSAIFLALIVLLAGIWGVNHYVIAPRSAASQRAEAAKAAALKAQQEAKAQADAEVKAKAEAAAAFARVDHVVHKGQGPQHVFIRKLMDDPSIVDSTPGLHKFTGDQNDQRALKKWAGHEAAVASKDSGIVGKFGEEYRVRIPDTVAFDLVKDPVNGHLKVVQYAASTLVAKAVSAGTTDTVAKVAPPTTIAPQEIVIAGGESFSQVAAFTVAASVAASHAPFTTKPDGTIVFHSPFAYIYDGTPSKDS